MMTGQDDVSILPGTVLKGKWHGKHYQIIRKLGSGAQGTVYLAHADQRTVAVKVAKDRASLISEMNVLKEFNQLGADLLGPYLYDTDDWQEGGRLIAFSVMEYLRGTALNEALPTQSFDWIAVFLVQLLRHLQNLHRIGYAFGDLKPENLMLMDPGHHVRCLDFGGATRLGRSIREYTEFYDRGYWGLGTRKAEPGYDLFACGMIMLYAASGRRFEKSAHPEEQLLHICRTKPQLAPYREIVAGALTGRYTSADQMRRDLLSRLMERQNTVKAIRPKKKNRRSAKKDWAKAWMTASLLLGVYVIFVMIYIM
ncbi:hypothetical protein E4665_15240 [Sporolactobacillus shoreae]|uniref:Protein kinase domain-containing protein n=1 Tax=Sporolactobacillus shoreae TaxID=1465501 RepID=A0A4Z0GKM8_9BACL|nr:phosphotransferase [Sporolactobacillus shoreae]TGA96537.1 hypothetical protein E4665_15240 [Sporolactobacillus shoreae]